MLALEYYRKNPEPFKQEDEEVLKIMIERDYTLTNQLQQLKMIIPIF
jgi:hypothetical protein